MTNDTQVVPDSVAVSAAGMAGWAICPRPGGQVDPAPGESSAFHIVLSN